jgi:hypothetical protein
VPAVVDLSTETGFARLYRDILEPIAGDPLPEELRPRGAKRQGLVEDSPYMKLQHLLVSFSRRPAARIDWGGALGSRRRDRFTVRPHSVV